MTRESDNSNDFKDRCAYFVAKGRRCRLPAGPGSSMFCPQHAPFGSQNPDTIDLSPALLGHLSGLRNPEDMQEVLGRIFFLLAEGRITTKRAAVLTYIVQQLLRTLPAIDRQQKAAEEAEPQGLVLDIPRRKRA